MKIRRARLEEASALTELSLRSKRSNGYDDAFMAECREELTVTEARLTEGEYWVADAGIVCGCACLLADPENRTGEVHAFFVDPDWQGKGIGRLLWQKMLERAKTQALIELHLDADPFAVSFYEALGLKVTGDVSSGSIAGRRLPYMSISIEHAGRSTPPVV